MAGSVTITVALFGAFREAAEDAKLTLHLPTGSDMTALRQALHARLGDLVQQSALADESHILHSNAVFERDTSLAILPPVCGG